VQGKDSHAIRTALAVVMAGTVLTAVACTSSPSVPTSASPLADTCLTNRAAPVAIAAGVRSDVPKTQFPAAVNTLLETAAADKEQISLVRIDGQPKIFRPAPFSTTDQNSTAVEQDINQYINNTIEPVLSGPLHAQVAQADVLTALDLAAAATAPNGNIVLIDSGLQTVAPLQYQSGLMMSPSADIVSFLRSKNLIPDLHGRHVLLSGFGYTSTPEPALNEAERNNVISQWEAIVRAGGGCVSADSAPNTAPELAGLPAVTTVPLPKPVVIHPCGTTVLSDSGSVGFAVGTATFRDKSAADGTLRQLASTLKRGSEPIKLIGSTSSEGGDAVNNPLSQQRADAVQAALVSMGVPAGRITSTGEGANWPGRVNDIGPNGGLLPAQAEQDREVIVQLPRCSA
jgi:outer membrane protein OmpA-like peptidoglycan-associated protein